MPRLQDVARDPSTPQLLGGSRAGKSRTFRPEARPRPALPQSPSARPRWRQPVHCGVHARLRLPGRGLHGARATTSSAVCNPAGARKSHHVTAGGFQGGGPPGRLRRSPPARARGTAPTCPCGPGECGSPSREASRVPARRHRLSAHYVMPRHAPLQPTGARAPPNVNTARTWLARTGHVRWGPGRRRLAALRRCREQGGRPRGVPGCDAGAQPEEDALQTTPRCRALECSNGSERPLRGTPAAAVRLLPAFTSMMSWEGAAAARFPQRWQRRLRLSAAPPRAGGRGGRGASSWAGRGGRGAQDRAPRPKSGLQGGRAAAAGERRFSRGP